MSAMLDEAKNQVATKLAAKPFYRPDMKAGLVTVLMENCQSVEHIRRVCSAALTMRFGPPARLEDRCPGPAELADLCREIDPVGKRKEASPDCPLCAGEGWETGDGARRCRCGGWPMSQETRARLNGSPVFGKTERGGEVSKDPEMQALVSGIAREKIL